MATTGLCWECLFGIRPTIGCVQWECGLPQGVGGWGQGWGGAGATANGSQCALNIVYILDQLLCVHSLHA